MFLADKIVGVLFITRNNAQIVLFTFRAPSSAQMALLDKSLGANAPFIQHVHGFAGLVQWTRLFFTSAP